MSGLGMLGLIARCAPTCVNSALDDALHCALEFLCVLASQFTSGGSYNVQQQLHLRVLGFGLLSARLSPSAFALARAASAFSSKARAA